MLLLSLYFPNSTTACRLGVFGLNLLYNRLSTFFGVGSPELYLYHSKATTEEILVRNMFKYVYNILDNKEFRENKITLKNIPMQWDKHVI